MGTAPSIGFGIHDHILCMSRNDLNEDCFCISTVTSLWYFQNYIHIFIDIYICGASTIYFILFYCMWSCIFKRNGSQPALYPHYLSNSQPSSLVFHIGTNRYFQCPFSKSKRHGNLSFLIEKTEYSSISMPSWTTLQNFLFPF